MRNRYYVSFDEKIIVCRGIELVIRDQSEIDSVAFSSVFRRIELVFFYLMRLCFVRILGRTFLILF